MTNWGGAVNFCNVILMISKTEWASKNIKSSVVTCLPKQTLLPKSTACAFLRLTRSLLSPASGTSLGACITISTVLHGRNIPSIQATKKGQESQWRNHWCERRTSFDMQPLGRRNRILTLKLFFVF